jgi:hypothetical protein
MRFGQDPAHQVEEVVVEFLVIGVDNLGVRMDGLMDVVHRLFDFAQSNGLKVLYQCFQGHHRI